MTLLELVNRARHECGVSGPDLSSVQNLSGEAARIRDWVKSAWIDLQSSKEDWNFMRKSMTFTLTEGKQFYTPTEASASDLGNWKRDSFRCSTNGNDYKDEQLLNYMDYTTFRNLYMYANMRTTQTRPVVVTIDPHKSLGFGALPDRDWQINGEYYRKPPDLTQGTDTPDIPDRYHWILVYRVMMYYGGYEAAGEVYQRGLAEFKRNMNWLEIDQLPTLTFGPPLA